MGQYITYNFAYLNADKTIKGPLNRSSKSWVALA